jgi:hypothetical protein
MRSAYLNFIIGLLALGLVDSAEASPGYAFATVECTAAGCTAPADRWYSSTGTVSAARLGIGNYTVNVGSGLGSGGNVQVTALGSSSAYCKVASWGSSSVAVRCYSAAGSATDSKFTLSLNNYQGSSDAADAAYVWAHFPSGASYTPLPQFSYNGFGGANRITRSGVGTYTVRMEGAWASEGHPQVTAYGANPTRCKVSSWSASSSAATVNVKCTADAMFSLVFVDGTTPAHALFGYGGSFGAYGWADNMTSSASYTVSLPYQWSSVVEAASDPMRSQWLSTGYYRVTIPELGDVDQYYPTNVLATAYGSDGAYCKVSSWSRSGPDAVVWVRCFSATGAPVNSRFNLLYQSDLTVLI